MSSDDIVQRDPVVAGALQTITPPEHGPRFWAELDRRLAGEPVPELRPGTEVVPLHPAFAPARRVGRGRWLAAAAVLLVVAMAAAVLSTRGGDGGGDVIADRPTPTSTATTATTAASPMSATTAPPTSATVPDPPAPASPDLAVAQWLDAVGEGDIDTAAALVGPRSRAYIDALGGELDGMLVEMGEGYGAWVASPDRSMTEVELGTLDGVDMTVVVVSGTWTGEGTTEQRHDTIPVVREDGRWLVEPVAFDPEVGGRIELIEPARLSAAAASGMPPDGIIEATAPGDGQFFFALDDGEVTTTGTSGVWDPPGDMTSQTHLLVVAYVDGPTLTALATTFAVEG